MTATVLDVTTAQEVRDAIMDARRDATPLEIRGSGSVLDRLPAGGERVLSVAGITGIVVHAAEDLTITVRAGTPVAELVGVLAAVGQECPIEPADEIDDSDLIAGTARTAAGAGTSGTVGGRIATALAGPRQLGAGRVRDWLLRVRVVTGAGQIATAGGVTVKDVTGYDVCRLMTGSWGTLAVLTELTLKLRPLARHRAWYESDQPRHDLDAVLYRPSSLITTTERTHVLLEGHPDDAAEQAAAASLTPAKAPVLPRTARAAVDPARLGALAAAVDGLGLRWATQDGVGVCHLDGNAPQLAAARTAAEREGGSLLVLDRTLGLPAFGSHEPTPIAERVRAALDPDGVLAPHRWTR